MNEGEALTDRLNLSALWLFRRGSLAWRVARRTFVIRRSLADSLLDVLDRIALSRK